MRTARIYEQIPDAVDANGDIWLSGDKSAQIEEEALERAMRRAGTACSHLTGDEAVLNGRDHKCIQSLC